MPVIVADVPLKGMVTDRLGKKLGAGEAPRLVNVWREAGKIRPRPGLTPFGAPAPDTEAVINLFNVEFANATRSFVRATPTQLFNYTGSTWGEIMPATPAFTGTLLQPFGMAVVLNELIMSNGVATDEVWSWTGTGDAAPISTRVGYVEGVLDGHDAFRYIVPFANRVVGAYTAAANGANTMVWSAIGSTIDWSFDNGGDVAVRNEHPSPITGLTADDTHMLVWKERAIVGASKTGEADTPFDFNMLETEGIGSIAPRSILAWGGIRMALSHEGLYMLSGGLPEFIDADIKRELLGRLNYPALAQVHSLVMPERAKILWFIPEAGDAFPRMAWVFDMLTRSWDRWEFGIPISSSSRAFLSTGRVVDDYDDPATDIVDTGIWANVIVDTLGTGPNSPSYILGSPSGETVAFDFSADDDNGADFTFDWQTPDVRWEGQVDVGGGHSKPIGPLDVVVLDRVAIEYQHSGSSADLECSVSVDGGLTWTVLGTTTLTTTSDSYAMLDFWGRISGNQIRVRLRISTVVGLPEFRNLTLFGQAAGERR